jgi:hypothetical protein
MPLRTDSKRAAAMRIVLAEEGERGWSAAPVGSWTGERKAGCDILSIPPGEQRPHHVEVKAWGEPLLDASGRFRYPQDIRASQYAAADRHNDFRVEIVANIDAYLETDAPYERLTLSAVEVRDRARPRLYDIDLHDLQDRIWRRGEPRAEHPDEGITDAFPDPIPDDDLRPEHLPLPAAPWGDIGRFALTFDGYRAYPDEACAWIANLNAAFWETRRVLAPTPLRLLRACLFFEQRRDRFSSSGPRRRHARLHPCACGAYAGHYVGARVRQGCATSSSSRSRAVRSSS